MTTNANRHHFENMRHMLENGDSLGEPYFDPAMAFDAPTDDDAELLNLIRKAETEGDIQSADRAAEVFAPGYQKKVSTVHGGFGGAYP